MSYDGETYTTHPLLDKDDLIREWQVFKIALKQETVLPMESKKVTEIPPMWEVKVHMECTGAYTGYFQKHLNLNIILVLPVGTVSVERSFSSMNW